MSLRLEALRRSARLDFIAYCRLHRLDHDESFLSEHDLEGFDPEGPEDRAFVLRDASGKIRGAGALMLRPDLLALGKARFRILHVEEDAGNPEEIRQGYSLLVGALAADAKAAASLYLFLPESKREANVRVAGIGFSLERKAWLLEKDLARTATPSLPDGFAFREARIILQGGGPGPDAAAWCAIVNEAFADLAGHSELTPSMLVADTDHGLAFPCSWLFLTWGRDAEAVGLCATVSDPDDGPGCAFLGPIAVLPRMRGRGLGRALLRAGLAAARAAGHGRCCLSVNAENEGALRLYLDEGFRKSFVMNCWSGLVSTLVELRSRQGY